ncbi:hypothetical protein BJX62DRAFT_245542 [Aspergillus germanicus]
MSAAPNSGTWGWDPRMYLMNRPEFSFPRLGLEHVGIYIPTNAPPGTVSIGRGIVVEVGISPRGQLDTAGHPMPAIYLPRDDDGTGSTGIDSDTMSDGDRSNIEELLRENARPGDEALGVYQSFDGRSHVGVGRVFTSTQDTGQAVRFDKVYRKLSATIEPSTLGKTHGHGWDPELHYMDRPVSISGLDPVIDGLERPKRLPDYRYADRHLVYDDADFPVIGSEAWGAYLAPDGRWYIGRCRVMTTGRRNSSRGYVLVEPIPGRLEEDYGFFHPVTMEHMPVFRPPVTTSMRWPWRSYFTQGLCLLHCCGHLPWSFTLWHQPGRLLRRLCLAPRVVRVLTLGHLALCNLL